MIDDFTNVHTIRRPKDQETSTARSMATMLLKRFPGVPAVPSQCQINPHGVSTDLLVDFTLASLPSLSQTFALVMPHWIRVQFFDPAMERDRVDIHDYQAQSNVRELRKMANCRIVDELELPLKSFNCFLEAANHAVSLGLDKYLNQFVYPQPGDWPAQFFMRQIEFNLPEHAPNCLKNIVPFLGPLHIQLNARECVCLLNIHFLKRAYSSIFGGRKCLANKPKPWKISLIEELLYGGWSLIRSHVITVFSNCKDVQYLTLLNLLDNYLPLVLSVYAVIFKTRKTDLYVSSLLRSWLL